MDKIIIILSICLIVLLLGVLIYIVYTDYTGTVDWKQRHYDGLKKGNMMDHFIFPDKYHKKFGGKTMNEHTIKRGLLEKILECGYEFDTCAQKNLWKDNVFKSLKEAGIKIIDEDYLVRAKVYKNESERLTTTTVESLDLKDSAIKYYEKHITQQDEKIKRLEGRG